MALAFHFQIANSSLHQYSALSFFSLAFGRMSLSTRKSGTVMQQLKPSTDLKKRQKSRSPRKEGKEIQWETRVSLFWGACLGLLAAVPWAVLFILVNTRVPNKHGDKWNERSFHCWGGSTSNNLKYDTEVQNKYVTEFSPFLCISWRWRMPGLWWNHYWSVSVLPSIRLGNTRLLLVPGQEA